MEQTPVVSANPPAPAQPTPAAPAAPTLEPSPREAVYAKYEQLYNPPSETQPPAAPAAPVTEPVATPTPAVEPPSVVDGPGMGEMIQVIAALQQQIEDLKNNVTRPPQPPPPPATPVVKEDWFDKLKAGDKEGFERELALAVQQQIAPSTIEEAVKYVTETSRAEREIDTFVNDLRSSNPELIPFEKFIAMDVQTAIIAAKQANKIASIDDYVKIYKAASQEAVTNARKLYQQVRAAGKQEAQTVAQTVVSATPVPPTAVTPPREGTPQKPTEEVESPQDYLARRQAATWARRGIPPS